MKLLNQITIQQAKGTAVLQLVQGDLSAIPARHKVDILVVSAFPDHYKALPGSLVLALEQKGVSLQKLAEDKESDFRSTVGCWFSKPLPDKLRKKLNFRQVLCFEPGTQSDDPVQVVGNIFRCLNNFVFDDSNNSVAMPVIASGYQKVPAAKMLPALYEAAIFWLQQGLPLKCIKIVIYREEEVPMAMGLFAASRQKLASKTIPGKTAGSTPRGIPKKKNAISPGSTVEAGFDYFISYAHTQVKFVQHFVEVLLKHKPGLRVFYDKTNILPGNHWIRQISEAISQAGKVLIFISPDYSSSMVCWDEFQCAKLKEYNSKASVIQTIYLQNDPQLPLIFGINSWIDCRESDLEKLADACSRL